MRNRSRVLGAALLLAAAAACDKAPTANTPPSEDARAALLRKYPTIADANLLALLRTGTPAGVGALLVPGEGAIIDNGTIQIGVRELGDLNVYGGTPSNGTGTNIVGLRFMATNNDATSPGCTCEGWGVADAGGTTFTGYANSSEGTAGLTLVSFNATGSTARSVVTAGGGSKQVRVTHDFAPAPETPNLYRVVVTIANIGSAAIQDLRYRRVFDWDVEPTPFDEFVTIQGTAGATSVLKATNNGFNSSDPLIPADGTAGDVVDTGPNDLGATFDFGFGRLDAGKTMSFTIYYGGAGTETGAINALKAVGAEVYSLGQPNVAGADPPSQISGRPNTFAFAFKGVGGESINKPPVATLGGPNSGSTGAALAFTTSASDPDGDAVSCRINFGDGSGDVSLASCGAGATRTFSTAGTYTVTLTARDPFGALGTATKTVVVSGGGGPPPPPACTPNTAPTLRLIAVYTHQAVKAFAPGIPEAEMLRFRFSDRNCGPWRTNIQWGDGHTSSFPISTRVGPGLYNTFHAYGAAGSYPIRMKITDAGGLSSAERAITAVVTMP